jgi:hypothetical protein
MGAGASAARPKWCKSIKYTINQPNCKSNYIKLNVNSGKELNAYGPAGA